MVKREELIGVRVSKEERELIETTIEKRKISLSDFIRESIFSHIYNLKKSKIFELGTFLDKASNIKEANEVISKEINELFSLYQKTI